MGTFNRILILANDTIELASTNDTIQIVSGSKDTMFQTCATATSMNDIWLACVLGSIIIVALLLVGLFIFLCMKSVQRSKQKERESQQIYEMTKLMNEVELQRKRTEHEDEWRKKEHEWKEAYNDKWKMEEQKLKERETVLEAEQSMKKLEIELKTIELKIKELEQKK